MNKYLILALIPVLAIALGVGLGELVFFLLKLKHPGFFAA